MLQIGIKGRQEMTVEERMSAKAIKSGELEVFATPAMIAFVENTALESVKEYLEEGTGTVGTKVNVSHIAATPVGMKVTCETELVEIDRRRLKFSVVVYDEKEKIAEGEHERFIIDCAKFMDKAAAKAKE